MQTPAPVSGQSYSTAFIPEAERSNYVRGGVTFTSAYIDNALGGSSGAPISDISYSVTPTLTLDQTTPRLHSSFTYAPGFTSYQKETYLNEADQNAAMNFAYRLSPHITLSASDNLHKSSSVFNQPDLGSIVTPSGGAQQANLSVIAPLAERLSNNANVSLTYQFSLSNMIGATGSFSNLHYPNASEVPDLYDASSQSGSIFYSFRLSRMHYFGATYQYQRLLSYLPAGVSETQTHAGIFFYSLIPSRWFSFSLFGGPQYSETVQPAQPQLQLQALNADSWNPAVGGSVGLQSRITGLAVSYSHVISGGGGLVGAVHMDHASLAIKQRLTAHLNASMAGSYTQNNFVGTAIDGNYNGHSLIATASITQQFGEHVSAQLAYSRLHQDYSGVAILSTNPNTNRESIAISYHFSRPLGR